MNIKYNEAERCPLCGSDEVSYGSMEYEGEGLYFPCECEKCHAIWREWYHLEFVEVYDVMTADGQEVSE